MKKIITLILAALLCFGTSAFLLACDDETAVELESPVTEESDTEDTEKQSLDSNVGLSKMDNYTLTLEGLMTVTKNGVEEGKTNMKQVLKIADGKAEIILFVENGNGEMEQAGESMLLEGEMAKAQTEQNNKLLETILAKYDKFVYDAETESYAITETITVEEVVDGVEQDHVSGTLVPIKVPTKITIKDAKVTLTEDGKLAKLVCDYTQEMNLEDGITVTSGINTWTVTDYGTTVIG